MAVIKKINTGTSVYEIDAAYLGSRSAADWEAMIHGAIETYVVPTSKSGVAAYGDIVGNTDATITLTQAELKSLVEPAKEFQVGDVILLEAPSTDTAFMFDRWISNIAGTSDNSNITLSILETHVQTHHHTITDTKASAIIGLSAPQTTTLAKVGTAVTVVTGVSGTPSVMTGVTYSGNGSHNINVATGTSTDGVGHSHSISGHTHTITPTALVSQNADAYTYLSTTSFTPHSHGTTSVAGAHKNSGAIDYATGVSSVSGTYVIDLKETSTNTGGQSLTTKSNAAANTSSITVAGTSTIESAKTASSGAHTHTVTTTTTEDVVKTVTLAPNVVTSVKYTAPTLAGTVVTNVPTKSQLVATSWSAAPTGTVVTSASWSCSVVSEVLTFNWGSSTGSAVTSATKISGNGENITVLNGSISTTTQNSGSFTSTSASQEHTSGTVGASGSAASAGGHQHGFNHTHAIPTHTHSIDSHTHTYAKTSVSSTGTPTVTLSTSSYTPHTHTSVTVVSSTTDSDPITYVYGGTKTTVVRTLKSTAVDTGSQALTTDSKYYKVTGDITLPALKATMTSLSTMLSTKSITPAATGEKAIKSVTPEYGEFVTDVDDKTSENKPGK